MINRMPDMYLSHQEPPPESGRGDRCAEDDPERGAGKFGSGRQPRELAMKLLDLRPHDRNIAAKLPIGIEQR